MHILIVGAGLGGLSAGLCFARRGHAVELLEQRDTLTPAGGGLHIRPPASRILHAWGLRPDLERIGEDTAAAVYRSLRTGRVATRSIAADAAEDPDWGAQRSDVVAVLYRRAREAGVRFGFGTTVTAVADEGKKAKATATAVLAGGGETREVQADLILVADGIRSRLRPQVLRDLPGGPWDPVASDLTLYGVELELDTELPLPDDAAAAAALRPLSDQGAAYLNVYLGRDRWVVARYYAKLRRQGLLFGVRGETDQAGMWDERGDLGFVRARFADACPELRAALGAATACDRWKLAEMPELPRWTSEGGRVLLLGDSAHAMHPNAAQGFSQIVEDIGVLEYLVSQSSPESASASDSESDSVSARVPRITSVWEEIRKPRVRRIQDWARFNSALFIGGTAVAAAEASKSKKTNEKGSSDDDDEEEEDGREISGGGGGWQVRSLKHKAPDMNADFNSSAFLKWAQSYDAVGEAQKYLQSRKPRL
ncbi:hypothetical protein F5X99DRAFT_385709 [Biscogniauxia marginata]|nr:hypothetical protein F5X99DRAFT_385709 [Biscogniauxia marginata]